MSDQEFAIVIRGLGKRHKRDLFTGGFAMHHQLEDLFRRSVRSLAGLIANYPSKDFSASGSNYFWALKDVSFDIRFGEVVGIIGHNGAGKSVLLKILSQITKPSEGYAELRGSCSSMLEVDSGFHPELTGRENIYMSGAILGMKRYYIKKKFDEIVDLAELAPFLDTPIKHYSSGMRVRLAFALAAQLQPDILILDEILAVGDESFLEKGVRHLKGLRQNGQTILIVSHNMQTILDLCDRVLWFDHGRLRGDGKPEDIINDYVFQHSELTLRR